MLASITLANNKLWKSPIITTSHRCDFDVVHAQDVMDNIDQFLKLYPRKNKPVLIKNVTTRWPAYTKWTKKYISEQLKDFILPGHESSGSGLSAVLSDDTWSTDITMREVQHPNAATPYLFSVRYFVLCSNIFLSIYFYLSHVHVYIIA